MLRQSLVMLLLAGAWAWGQSATQPAPAPAQPAQPPSAAGEETHEPRIRGLEIGMTAQQVLDLLGRMPDKREDKDGDILVYWKVEDNSLLKVVFHREHVVHLALQYRPPRPTADFWLVGPSETAHYDLTRREQRTSSQEGAPSQVQNELTVAVQPSAGAIGEQGAISSAASRDVAPRMGSSAGERLPGRDVRVRSDYKTSETADHERIVWKREDSTANGYRVEVQFLSAARQKLGSRYENQIEYKYVSVPSEDVKKFERAYAPRPEK